MSNDKATQIADQIAEIIAGLIALAIIVVPIFLVWGA